MEVWKGEEPSGPGRILQEAGIGMRIAAHGWGAHGSGGSFFSLFRKKRNESRLLVTKEDVARARELLSAAKSAKT